MSYVTPQLDYEIRTCTHSSPLMVEYRPTNNQNNFNLSQASTYGPVSFLLNSKVLNLHDSTIEFDIQCAATGPVNWYNGIAGSVLSRIVVTSQQTNNVVLDLNYADKFCQSVLPVCTKDVDLKNNYSSLYTSSTSAIPAVPTTGATGPSAPVGMFSLSNAIANPDCIGEVYPGAYDSRRVLFVGNQNATDKLSVALRLGDFKMTFLGINKLLYMAGENLAFDLYFNSTNKIGFTSLSATDPTSTPGAITSTMSINNLRMKVITEQDPAICEEIVSRVMSQGVKINFSYPFVYKSSLSGNSQSQNIAINSGYGSTCLAVISAPFNGTETGQTASDHSQYTSMVQNNTAANFQTLIDQIPIYSNTPANVFGSQMYLYNLQHLKNSIIKSAPQFFVDFCAIDNFCRDALCELDGTEVDGISLANQRNWSCQFNATGTGPSVATSWYFWVLVQKALLLTKDGVQVVS